MSRQKGEFSTAKVLRRLKELEEGWPEHLELFGWAGTLCLVRSGADPGNKVEFARSVLWSTTRIRCDGGDP